MTDNEKVSFKVSMHINCRLCGAHLQENNYDSSDTDYEKPSKDAVSSQKKASFCCQIL